MPPNYHNKAGHKVELSGQPIATAGGEGAIYDVLNDADIDLVAKIYHTPEMALARQGKIEFMIENSPIQNAEAAIQNAIVWPVEALYQNDQFVGFTMPKVVGAITLKSLTLPQNPSQKHGAEWAKFDHQEKGAHQKRLVVLYNLAKAIDTIHQRGNYVLVDLKPENIFVKPNGNISIIDLDGIQINNPNLCFPAKVYTEEFAPPELHKGLVSHKSGTIDEDWDYFSFAVIAYELLFGIHPFQASHQKYTTRPELIKLGYFVHGKKAKDLHVIPPVHKNFDKLHPNLQKLFFQTLEKGQVESHLRADTQTWSKELYPLLNSNEVYKTQIVLPKTLVEKQAPKNKKSIYIEEEEEDDPKMTLTIVLCALSVLASYLLAFCFYFFGLMPMLIVLITTALSLLVLHKIFGLTLQQYVNHPNPLFRKKAQNTMGIAFFILFILDLIVRPLSGFPACWLVLFSHMIVFPLSYGPMVEKAKNLSIQQFEKKVWRRYVIMVMSAFIPFLMIGAVKFFIKKTVPSTAPKPSTVVEEPPSSISSPPKTNTKSNEAPKKDERPTYGLGANKAEIIAIEGEPHKIKNRGNQTMLEYGLSTITLEADTMVAFTNATSIKLNIAFKENYQGQIQYYTIGSSVDQLIAIQGTPTAVHPEEDQTLYEYGSSRVYVKNDLVHDFYNSGRPKLKVEAALNPKAKKDYFTYGSQKEAVLRLHGEPDKKQLEPLSHYMRWYYGKNWVSLRKEKYVISYYNKHEPKLKIK